MVGEPAVGIPCLVFGSPGRRCLSDVSDGWLLCLVSRFIYLCDLPTQHSRTAIIVKVLGNGNLSGFEIGCARFQTRRTQQPTTRCKKKINSPSDRRGGRTVCPRYRRHHNDGGAISQYSSTVRQMFSFTTARRPSVARFARLPRWA
ncbi:unnamed protein product [Ectocarpus sp. 6 AP-2014]